MFYSQTFLGRKGPLGTVWIAAHMQSRLKKSHYAFTNIPSTVDRIMFPEVPLALRMLSHLLLGVVRIYSKKVDFLFHDCKVALTRLRKFFASVDLNLPEELRQAPLQTITLPETFDLDAIDLDDGFDLDRIVYDDHHLKSQEDITILDRIPVETEHYVCITFDEDVNMKYSDSREVPDSSATDMEPNPSNRIGEQETPNHNLHGSKFFNDVFQNSGPSNTPEICDSRHINDDNHSDEFIPEIETMRDATIESTPIFLDLGNVFAEPGASFSDRVVNEKEKISPISENIFPSHCSGLAIVQSSSRPQQSVASLQDLQVNDTSPLCYELRSTPSVQKPKPKLRPRKRKHHFDEAPVLKNKVMKRALEDTSDLVQERREIPHSALGIWKLVNKLLKEQVFTEPSITGFCSDLHDIYNDDYVSTKLESLSKAKADSEVEKSPAREHESTEFQTPARNDDVEEIEILRYADRPEIIPSSIATPESQVWSLIPGLDTEMDSSKMDTPGLISKELGLDFSTLPEVDDDLFFLEADNSTPSESQEGIQGVKSLSVRTRAVVQYIKRLYREFPSSSENISLNKLLHGKTRKLCARMLFETLVLKSNDLVNVEQEVAYGEIILTVTHELSKAQF